MRDLGGDSHILKVAFNNGNRNPYSLEAIVRHELYGVKRSRVALNNLVRYRKGDARRFREHEARRVKTERELNQTEGRISVGEVRAIKIDGDFSIGGECTRGDDEADAAEGISFFSQRQLKSPTLGRTYPLSDEELAGFVACVRIKR